MRPPPFGHLDRHLAAQLSKLFVATLGGVVVLYLVVDFADRAHGFSGRAWGKAALELYWNKGLVVAYHGFVRDFSKLPVYLYAGPRFSFYWH